MMLNESTVRSKARVRGYTVSKSRDRSLHWNNCGQYMLDRSNTVVLGDRYDATLEDIAAFLAEDDAERAAR